VKYIVMIYEGTKLEFCMWIIGGSWLDEAQGQNIWGLEPLGLHKVGAYRLFSLYCLLAM